jgi:hypothetical protein
MHFIFPHTFHMTCPSQTPQLCSAQWSQFSTLAVRHPNSSYIEAQLHHQYMSHTSQDMLHNLCFSSNTIPLASYSFFFWGGEGGRC